MNTAIQQKTMTMTLNAVIENLWREFAAKLERLIRSRVKDPSIAEDIVQDVFLRLQQRIETIESIASLEGWLYRSARNAVIDHYRKHREFLEVEESIPDDSFEDTVELEDLKTAFRRMIFSLPEPYREAVVLADLEGRKQQEVAKLLGISLSGAKSRIQRGRALLRSMLEQCCTFVFDQRGRVIDCNPRNSVSCPACHTSSE